MHVAGTNGKGSTTVTLEALLRATGRRVGKYTSPHLIDFRERIVVDGEPIDGDRVARFIEAHRASIERIGVTFFEATTALAFQHFAECGVDVAVVETGLGGALDATNVVIPEVALVTSIGIDHVEFLGHTREAIAREKAGIFKAGRPAAIGDPDPAIADLLAQHAARIGAAPVATLLGHGWPADVRIDADGTNFTLPGRDGQRRRWTTPLVGRHQAANTAVALLAHDLMGEAYALDDGARQSALTSVRLPGRFQRRGRMILDVAHNPDGARVLARTLAEVAPRRPVTAVLAVLADKDWEGIMAALAPEVDRFILTTAPSAPAGRVWDPASAGEIAAQCGWRCSVVPRLEDAMAEAEREDGTVLVTGSFHTVGDVLARLPEASRAG